jgi:hypothetical protein
MRASVQWPSAPASTERAAQKIISELVEAGYLTRHRLGRRYFYEIHPDRPQRHPLEPTTPWASC